MDGDFFPILLFILFIVLPLIEKALKGGQQKPEQRPRRPPERRLPRDRPDGLPSGDRERPEVLSGGAPTRERDRVRPREESAAEMVPDDLWAILTGESRPRREPAPVPAPRQEAPVEAAPWQAPQEEAELEATLRRREEEQKRRRRELEERLRRERAGRTPVVRKAPTVVSLERPLGDPELRHERFHEEVEARRAAARAAPRRSGRGARVGDLALGSQAELRRALVLQEVLGPPRALHSLEESIAER